MTYALVTDGSITKYPAVLLDIRKAHPNTSFPKNLDGLDLSGFGVVTVSDSDQPSFDANTKTVTEGAPTLVDGTWTQTWSVSDLSDEQVAANTASIAASVRNERNRKLANSDWTQLADSSANATLWGTYRTQLRDLPTSSGFPNNITWPTEPS